MNLPGNPYLPPGCTQRMIDEAAGLYQNCCLNCGDDHLPQDLSDTGLCERCEQEE